GIRIENDRRLVGDRRARGNAAQGAHLIGEKSLAVVIRVVDRQEARIWIVRRKAGHWIERMESDLEHARRGVELQFHRYEQVDAVGAEVDRGFIMRQPRWHHETARPETKAG